MIKNEPSKAQTANDLLMRGVPRIGFWIYCYWRCFWSPATVLRLQTCGNLTNKTERHFPATRGTPNWQSPGCFLQCVEHMPSSLCAIPSCAPFAPLLIPNFCMVSCGIRFYAKNAAVWDSVTDRILRPCQEFTYPFFRTLCFCKKLLVYFIDFFTNCFSAFRPRPLGKHWRSIIDWHKLCSLRCVFDLYRHLEPAMILTILLLFYLSAPGGDDFQWFQCRTVSHVGCAAIFGRRAISDATK